MVLCLVEREVNVACKTAWSAVCIGRCMYTSYALSGSSADASWWVKVEGSLASVEIRLYHSMPDRDYTFDNVIVAKRRLLTCDSYE